MLPPEALRNAAQSPVEQHLKEYVADLAALNRDGQYVYELKNRVRRLIRACGWNLLRDITADSSWRAKQTLSPKTARSEGADQWPAGAATPRLHR
jgi:hypothetical protein